MKTAYLHRVFFRPKDVNREAVVLFEERLVLEPASQALRRQAAACPQTV